MWLPEARAARSSCHAHWTSVAGTDEDVVFMLLSARSNDQRQQIKAEFKKAYGKVSRAARNANRELSTTYIVTRGEPRHVT